MRVNLISQPLYSSYQELSIKPLDSIMKFKDVTIGQEVRVKLNETEDESANGVVRYKGSLVSLDGFWVGVELTSKLGTSNGLYKGNQHFSCREGYGIYVRAGSLSLLTRQRKLYDVYRKLGPSSVQDDLFRSTKKQTKPDLKHSCTISQSYLTKAKSAFSNPRVQTCNSLSIFHYQQRTL